MRPTDGHVDQKEKQFNMSSSTVCLRSPRKITRRMALGASVAAAALAVVPAAASAASSCSFTPSSFLPTVQVVDGSGPGVPVRIVRSGQSIAIADGSGSPRVCGSATVSNVQFVKVTSNEPLASGPGDADGFVLDESQGAFMPGFGDEPDGLRELEVLFKTTANSSRLRVVGTSGADYYRIGAANKIMVGGDADNDITLDTPTTSFFSSIRVEGGPGNDYISGRGGYPLSSPLPYSATSLHIQGDDGNDTLVDGLQHDQLTGGNGDDYLYTADGRNDASGDLALGGPGFDRAHIDMNASRQALDFTEAEQVTASTVGVLRLSPGVVKAKAGNVANVEMSWKHPEAWKQLRNVEVRLFRANNNTRVGAFKLTAKPERITRQGNLRLVRSASGVTHRGKAVIAKLAVRLPKSMSRSQLRVDVEATDRNGQHQLEPGAGLITIK
jgi:hypothetical protein